MAPTAVLVTTRADMCQSHSVPQPCRTYVRGTRNRRMRAVRTGGAGRHALWGGMTVRAPYAYERRSYLVPHTTGDNLFLSRAPACDRRRGVTAPYASGGLDIRSRALVQQLNGCAEVLASMLRTPPPRPRPRPPRPPSRSPPPPPPPPPAPPPTTRHAPTCVTSIGTTSRQLCRATASRCERPYSHLTLTTDH